MKMVKKWIYIFIFGMFMSLCLEQYVRVDAASFKRSRTVIQTGKKMVYKKGKKLYAKGTSGKAVALGKADGAFAVKKDVVYYTDRGTLYRVQMNGKKRKKMAASAGEILGIKGKSVISYRGKTIYQTTGTTKKKAVTDRYMEKAVYHNGKVYGMTGIRLYSFSLKPFSSSKGVGAAWKKGVKIANADYTGGLFSEGEYLYFVSSRKDELQKLYRLGKAGELESIAEGENLQLLAVSGEEVLYALRRNDISEIYLKAGDDEGKKLVSQEAFRGISINSVGSGAVSAKKIVLVWAGDDTKSGLFSMNKDGSGIRLLSKAVNLTNPAICGGRVYFGKSGTEDGNVSYTSMKI